MNIYDFNVETRDGELLSLKEYQGKVMLIINSATQCGFTSQYDDLQTIYERYAEEDFVILDFPCNQFGNQAPGSNQEIAMFCDSRYGITFPIFSKINVNGEQAVPLFEFLKKEQPFKGFDQSEEAGQFLHNVLSSKDPEYDKNNDIKWNFTKFLVDREGNVVARFEPTEEMYDVEEQIKELVSIR